MSEELKTENECIARFLHILGIQNGFCVDIGASDGVSGSNTITLLRNGWKGLSIEAKPDRFSHMENYYKGLGLSEVKLLNNFVYPDNVIELLTSNSVPTDFDFLSLDIDGYDYFVMDSILKSFRPKLICCEINEKIPPPIKFSVSYNRSHSWDESHFYGMSISKLNELAIIHNYSLVKLHYCNAFLIPREISPFKSLSPEQAYVEGYKDRDDRIMRFPWNLNVDKWMNMNTQDAIQSIKEYFSSISHGEEKYEISA